MSLRAKMAMSAPTSQRAKPVNIAIPLKPREKPVDLPEEYQRTLRNELDVRYLESIGAAPSLLRARPRSDPDEWRSDAARYIMRCAASVSLVL